MRRVTIGFVILTLALICLAGLSATRTVRSQGMFRNKEKESWYQERERQLVLDTRAYLNGGGFRDSGVNLTRVVDPGGARRYTFTIHHARINRMGEAGRQRLKEDLAVLTKDFACAVPGETCEFYYEFLFVEEDP